MLNAVKHLYRFSSKPFNEAVEVLHCVQHDNYVTSSLLLP
jgi:hypothetical protein